MNEVKISLIVLSYNNTEYLEDCFMSINKQNFLNFEVIFCDDCTKDIDVVNTKNKISNILGDKVNVKFLFNEINLGTVKNINNGINYACGEIIVFLSLDDMLYDENSLSNIYEFFCINNDVDVATSLRQNFIEQEYLSVSPTKRQLAFFNNNLLLKKKILLNGNFIGGCNTYYRKKFFDEYGKFDENYILMEDLPNILFILNNNIKIGFIKSKCLLYRLGGVSNSKPSSKYLNDIYYFYQHEILNEKKYYKRICKFRYHIYNKNIFLKLFWCLIYFDVFLLDMYYRLK